MNKRILITAFEPFGGETVNPAQKIAEALSQRSYPDIEICTKLIPVTFSGSAPVAIAALAQNSFDVVAMLGQAGGRAAVTIERVAINVDDASIPDNAGDIPNDRTIAPDGPAAYFATIPVKGAAEAIRAAGISASVSNSAGTYVCNHLMYSVLHHLRESNVRAGFIHVPFLPEQAANKENAPSMPLADMIRAIEAILPVV